jgi:hypothetical protein
MSPNPSRTRGRPGGSAAPPAEPVPTPADSKPASGPFAEASPEARRLAATVLEVLAGTQLPSEAARALGVSLARYYQLELRAVSGLVSACEPRRRGRGQPPGPDLAGLRRECERLQRECARQQALVRAARRAVGLACTAPAPPPPDGGRQRRRRRPTARALKMAALLQPPEPSPARPTEPAPGETRPLEGGDQPARTAPQQEGE